MQLRSHQKRDRYDVEYQESNKISCGHVRAFQKSVLHGQEGVTSATQDDWHTEPTQPGLGAVPDDRQEDSDNDSNVGAINAKDQSKQRREQICSASLRLQQLTFEQP